MVNRLTQGNKDITNSDSARLKMLSLVMAMGAAEQAFTPRLRARQPGYLAQSTRMSILTGTKKERNAICKCKVTRRWLGWIRWYPIIEHTCKQKSNPARACVSRAYPGRQTSVKMHSAGSYRFHPFCNKVLQQNLVYISKSLPFSQPTSNVSRRGIRAEPSRLGSLKLVELTS